MRDNQSDFKGLANAINGTHIDLPVHIPEPLPTDGCYYWIAHLQVIEVGQPRNPFSEPQIVYEGVQFTRKTVPTVRSNLKWLRQMLLNFRALQPQEFYELVRQPIGTSELHVIPLDELEQLIGE